MSEGIPIKGSGITVIPQPIVREVGTDEVRDVGKQVSTGVAMLTERFIREGAVGDKVHVSITSNFGNEIRTTEMLLETIPDDTPTGFSASVRRMLEDGSIVSEPINVEFQPVPKATVRMCTIETNEVPQAGKLFDQLTSGFHFNEKLMNIEFEPTEEN